MDTNIQHAGQPNSPLAALPLNKTAQFLLGLLIIFVTFKLWWSGWFSMRLMEASGMVPPETDGFGNPIGLLPFVLDSVCLVGVIGFWTLSFLRGLITHLHSWFKSRVNEPLDQVSMDQAVGPQQLDPKKLASVLGEFESRISQLEMLHPEAFPEPQPEPTVEELMKEIRELRQKLAEQNSSPQVNQDAES